MGAAGSPGRLLPEGWEVGGASLLPSLPLGAGGGASLLPSLPLPLGAGGGASCRCGSEGWGPCPEPAWGGGGAAASGAAEPPAAFGFGLLLTWLLIISAAMWFETLTFTSLTPSIRSRLSWMSWHILNPNTVGQNGLVRCRSTFTFSACMSTSSMSSRSVIDVLISGSTIFESSSNIRTRIWRMSCSDDTAPPAVTLYITISATRPVYRSRLGGGLDEEAAAYASSVAEDAEIAAYDILGSQAHVVMLHDCGIVTRADAARILGALDRIGGLDYGALAGGAGAAEAEDVHELVESLVAAEAGAAAGGRMHTARSRNDQVAADMRMKVRDDAMRIMDLIVEAAGALVRLASAHTGTAMPLYTHLQQAQAGTLSHYLLAHADALVRDHGRFAGAFARANLCPLGAGPVGGTRLPIDREKVAGLLGFDGLVENSIDATSSRDFAAEFASAAAVMAGNASRLAEDLVLWSSAEFGFVELADRFASPSSVMPQKKNPDVLELVRGRAASTIGSLVAVLGAIKGLPTGYGRDLQEVKPHVWAASRNAAGALAVIAGAIGTVTVNKAAMRRAAGGARGYLTALDVADRLVEEGVAFRAAHGIAGRLVRAADARGVSLARLGRADVARAVREAGAGAAVSAGAVGRIARECTVSDSLKSRSSQGSAGPAEQARMIRDRTEMLGALAAENAKRRGAVDAAIAALRGRAGEILKGGRGRKKRKGGGAPRAAV